ncbi:MAG: LysM peptidoglycan-binding domain-containing protein [Anaerolineae bacterium]|nr:LysM peptidoglycan-binding domain-containing protein [Anaerolineae bacterium]
MTRRMFALLALVLLLVSVPLTGCNRSAVQDVPSLDEAMQEEAAGAEPPTVEEPLDQEEPTDEETAEATEPPTDEATDVATEVPTDAATETPTEAPADESTPEATPAPTQAPVAPPSSSEPGTHTVQPGENLFRIALKYGVTVDALASANGITNPAFIYVGQILTIPGGGAPGGTTPPPSSSGGAVHVVQPGENLFRIALRYGFDYYYLAQYNSISDPTLVYVGQQIRIPPK